MNLKQPVFALKIGKNTFKNKAYQLQRKILIIRTEYAIITAEVIPWKRDWQR